MVILKGKLVTLRPVRMSDAKDIYKNASAYDICKWVVELTWPYKYKDTVKFLKNVIHKKHKDQIRFAIVLNQTKEVIGVIGFIRIDKKNKHAFTSTWITKRYWGQGINAESKKLLINFGFKKLKLHKISLYTLGSNKRSQKAIKKLGAKKEGVLRDKVFKSGRFHDMHAFSILKKEWKPSKLRK